MSIPTTQNFPKRSPVPPVILPARDNDWRLPLSKVGHPGTLLRGVWEGFTQRLPSFRVHLFHTMMGRTDLCKDSLPQSTEGVYEGLLYPGQSFLGVFLSVFHLPL